MNRTQATTFCRENLDKHNLSDWSVRLTTDMNVPFLGKCVYKDKSIILNAHHIDIHPEAEVINTILHEVAHTLTPGHAHDDIWAAKAREIGCNNTLPCSHLNIPDHIVDAIRSGATIEMTFEEETHVVRKPKYTISRLQDKCPYCGKVAKEKFSFKSPDKDGNTVHMITLECFHVIKKIIPKGTAFNTMVSNFWKPEVSSCIHDWTGQVKNKCTKCGEFKLMNFQITGAHFLESALAMQKGAAIFDDMGLGKTVQGLAIPRFHPDKYCPFLVVTKSAVTYQWFSQIVRWLGPTYFAQIIKTSKDTILPSLKSYIIPYDLMRRLPEKKKEWLRDNIKLVILDECQQIKNPDSSRTQEVRNVCRNPTLKVIELSGTPWKNRGSEFFPALNLIDPMKFFSYQDFVSRWVETYFDTSGKLKQGGISNIPRFKQYTENLILRREFNEVIDEFPDINRVKLQIQLDSLTQTTYDDAVSDFVSWYNDYVISGKEDKINGLEILAKLARMRHITGLAKIPATMEFLDTFIEETDRKIVVFVHHKDVGQILHQHLTDATGEYKEFVQVLKENNIKVLTYHSGLNSLERNNIQNEFNNAPRAIMIASTLAAGEGVDLQTCSDCILHERQWNPQNEEQAAPGRFRRIGQTAKVITVTVIEAEGTVDEHLDGVIEEKRLQFHKVMNTGEVQTWNQGDIGKQLAETIIKKHNEKNKGKPKNNLTNKTKLNPTFTEMSM